MGERTGIEWCDHTWSPWTGCLKVSAGCAHCYAEVDTPARVARHQGLELWGPKAARKPRAESGWKEPLAWFRKAVRDGVRRRVFCGSQCDVFEDRRDLDAHRERLWHLIDLTADATSAYSAAWRRELGPGGGLDWLLLTKRPQHIMRLIPERWRAGLPPNVWVGTSVEDQPAADERIDELRKVPAVVRFVSFEPLLGPVRADLRGIAWAIIGGESGQKARPCDVAWVRDLVAQCRAADVQAFCKQLGANVLWDGVQRPGETWLCGEQMAEDIGGRFRVRLADPKGGDLDEMPDDLRVQGFPGDAYAARA